MARTHITALIRVPGLHHWPHAHAGRSYLAAPHRHLFHVKATVAVEHDERDVEFHDLADLMSERVELMGTPHGWGAIDFGPKSCETLARELLSDLHECRVVSVEWSEDGEFSAIVYAEEATP